MHRRNSGLSYLLAFLSALLFPVVVLSQQVAFHVYDAEGNELRWEKFRFVEENWLDIQTSGYTERKPLCDLCRLSCPADKCDKSVCDIAGGDVDIILNPADLTVAYGDDKQREARTLYSSEGADGNGPNGFPVFDFPKGEPPLVTLALAWPTQGGYYSTVLLDIPRPGTREGFYEPVREGETPFFVFNLVAAQQAIERLEQMLRARSAPAPGRPRTGDEFGLEYRPSPTFTQHYEQAKSLFTDAKGATKEKDKGRWGAQAFDAAVAATLTLLSEYGVQYARSRAPATPPQWGVTFESIDTATFEDDLDSVARMVDDSRVDGWVRLVFNERAEPETYMPVIREAHRRGLRVLGELRDSYELKGIRRDAWKRYVKKYVDALSDTKVNPRCNGGDASAPDCDVDEWEVGNKVTGEWTADGTDKDAVGSGAYIYDAADYIKNKKRSQKRILLTLYWQLGNLKNPKFSMFEWLKKTFIEGKSPVKDKDKSPLKGQQGLFDDIGISLYPDKTPMGVSFDRVVTTLRTFFPLPHQRIMITELGYSPEPQTDPVCQYGHIWRLGAVPSVADDDPHRDTLRGEAAQLYQAAVLGYPYSGGGPYWWYYLQERGSADKPGAVWKALHTLYQSIKPPAPTRIR